MQPVAVVKAQRARAEDLCGLNLERHVKLAQQGPTDTGSD